MKTINDLKVHIYSDGAKMEDFKSMIALSHIKGFTTNPTLMKKGGVTDYEAFIKEVLPIVGRHPISFEVFSDDLAEMKKQAMRLKGFGENVYVKIPVTNTKKESTAALVRELSQSGVKLNVTAILTRAQVETVVKALAGGAPSVVSVFAGRIADTGVDPMPAMKEAKKLCSSHKGIQLLWASTRELLNIFQADEAGCDIVTVPPDILKKLSMVGYDLDKLSVDTVKMFYDDATSSGFKLNC